MCRISWKSMLELMTLICSWKCIIKRIFCHSWIYGVSNFCSDMLCLVFNFFFSLPYFKRFVYIFKKLVVSLVSQSEVMYFTKDKASVNFWIPVADKVHWNANYSNNLTCENSIAIGKKETWWLYAVDCNVCHFLCRVVVTFNTFKFD